jgi:hypothetical protein
MSTYSLEDFYLQQVSENLIKNKFSCSQWERSQEKSSTWFCYVYQDSQFVGKMWFNFIPDFNANRLIPLKVDIDLDTHIKRDTNGIWTENQINHNFKYGCSFDLNQEDSLKMVCDLILKLIEPKKVNYFWNAMFKKI